MLAESSTARGFYIATGYVETLVQLLTVIFLVTWILITLASFAEFVTIVIFLLLLSSLYSNSSTSTSDVGLSSLRSKVLWSVSRGTFSDVVHRMIYLLYLNTLDMVYSAKMYELAFLKIP